MFLLFLVNIPSPEGVISFSVSGGMKQVSRPKGLPLHTTHFPDLRQRNSKEKEYLKIEPKETVWVSQTLPKIVEEAPDHFRDEQGVPGVIYRLENFGSNREIRESFYLGRVDGVKLTSRVVKQHVD